MWSDPSSRRAIITCSIGTYILQAIAVASCTVGTYMHFSDYNNNVNNCKKYIVYINNIAITPKTFLEKSLDLALYVII